MGLYVAESVTDWLYTKGVQIDTKKYDRTELVITTTKANYIGVVTIGVIPLYIFGAGLVVYRKRRFL